MKHSEKPYVSGRSDAEGLTLQYSILSSYTSVCNTSQLTKHVCGTTVSVSGVTYCNINPESYLSYFRGPCYLFTLLFLCPLVRKEIPVGFDWSPVRHFSHPVEQVGEIFKEVDAMQPAGTCQ